jgi:hypothetical protein
MVAARRRLSPPVPILSPFTLALAVPDPLTLTPGYAMLSERAYCGRQAMALQRLFASSSQNRPSAGAFPAPPRALPPLGGSYPHPRVPTFLRTMRAFSASSHPFCPLRPPRVPRAESRALNAWGFLQEAFSRVRMGFPPAVAVPRPPDFLPFLPFCLLYPQGGVRVGALLPCQPGPKEGRGTRSRRRVGAR